MSDSTPRPVKRRKLDSSPQATITDSASSSSSALELTPLPPAVLLVSLPGLLAHPPNHRFYIHSLVLSITALQKCLALPALPPEIECRAWTGLAEIGMKVISGGLSQNDDHPWAKGMEIEVEKAISKGAIIAQKHPSLRAYQHQLALLQAQLSHWQHKTKFARNQLRNLLASFLLTDPPHIVYSTHLAYISLLITPAPSPLFADDSHPTSSPRRQSPQDIHAGLSALEEVDAYSRRNDHRHATLLARVLRLRILVAAAMWTAVPEALQRAEESLGLSYEASSTPTPRKAPRDGAGKGAPAEPEATFISFEDAFETAMAVHVLMMSVTYFTHVGNAAEASPRLSHLHALLDSGALDKFPNGTVEISFPDAPSLIIEVTHPRVLFLLAFLVSATAKRDAVGRKPKRKVFASEGLATWESEFSREIDFTLWAGMGDVEELEQRLAKIKADLLCELIAVSIMRSEFDAAEENLDLLIAHTRTYDIFPLFSARIALHHAHLAHALGRTARALECYQVAAYHAEKGSFVETSARLGEVVLSIGMKQSSAEDGDEGTPDAMEIEMKVIRACREMGGTLDAAGRVIEACLSPEILRAKQHLKHALTLATKAQDNHLRALILALIASHYMHTAGDHALEMLQTCEQLAAGLGAPPTKPPPSGSKAAEKKQTVPLAIGNAPLSLWVGERFLELFRRAGKDSRAKKQEAVNKQLATAVEDLARRAASAEKAAATS